MNGNTPKLNFNSLSDKFQNKLSDKKLSEETPSPDKPLKSRQSLPQIFFDKVTELRNDKVKNLNSDSVSESPSVNVNHPFRDNDFKIDDLDSLQEASIDENLLNDYFINSRFKFEQTKKDVLMKHARRYGYIKIPEEMFRNRQENLRNSRNREFIEKKKNLETQILHSQKKLRDQLSQMDKESDGSQAFKAVTGFMQIKMIQNKLEI